MILHDLEKVREGDCSIVVIDSQGDLLRNISHLAELPSERVVIIDPNDMDYPPALNLFDLGLDRLSQYDTVEREKLINGAISLYEYIFGELLGAELTNKQGVIFRFIARLMMVVPDATIHTLMDFMDEPHRIRPYISKLEGSERRFFEREFLTTTYDSTRQQIKHRLYGVLGKRVMERMLGNEKNKLDLFQTMNRGSIILINTAKELLKDDCKLFGRFFIALICQAVQERSAIPEGKRKNTFIYIDEAHDYFDDNDESIQNLLTQARKYKVGITLITQSLGQYGSKLRSTVLTNTAIKIGGGVSTDDAKRLAPEMRCDPKFLLNMQKGQSHSQFACFVKDHTAHPVPLSVPFGEMERQPQVSDDEYQRLLERNRARFCGVVASRGKPVDVHPEEQNVKHVDAQIDHNIDDDNEL